MPEKMENRIQISIMPEEPFSCGGKNAENIRFDYNDHRIPSSLFYEDISG